MSQKLNAEQTVMFAIIFGSDKATWPAVDEKQLKSLERNFSRLTKMSQKSLALDAELVEFDKSYYTTRDQIIADQKKAEEIIKDAEFRIESVKAKILGIDGPEAEDDDAPTGVDAYLKIIAAREEKAKAEAAWKARQEAREAEAKATEAKVAKK